ncbi:hypothetical protein D3C80_1855650 [compost metagenome]
MSKIFSRSARGMPGPWSRTAMCNCASTTDTCSSSRPLAGEKRAAFSSTLTSACSINAAWTNSNGNSVGTKVCTRNGASTTRRRLSALPTMSTGATQSRASLRPPWPRRVMSSKFWM